MATIIAFATFVSVTLLGGSIRMSDVCCRCWGLESAQDDDRENAHPPSFGGGSSFHSATSEEEMMVA
jgi:hypothetical protein